MVKRDMRLVKFTPDLCRSDRQLESRATTVRPYSFFDPASVIRAEEYGRLVAIECGIPLKGLKRKESAKEETSQSTELRQTT